MKIIFAGTPEFAAVVLEHLLRSEHQIVAVYTQPDRPKGRGLKLAASPVKQLALQYKLPLNQPVSLKDSNALAKLADYHADVMIVVAYGLLLPAALLTIPKYGCINIHPSLLPHWRGAAPIQRTIYAGDHLTGVTIMQMDTGLDTGPILLQQQYVLDSDETAQTLHDVLAKLGAEALIKTLDLLAQGNLMPRAQDEKAATYAHKISKEEALIDWSQTANSLSCQIRAFNPWPVAYTTWQSETLRVWLAKKVAQQKEATPRTIVYAGTDGIDIATGDGVLRLLAVQLPGGKVLNVRDFYNAKRNLLIVGEHFI